MEENLAAVLYKARDLRLETRPIPEPLDNEVLIQIQSTGICGSDIHYWHRGTTGRFTVKDPMVLGHESSGKVVKIGQKVTSLAVGEKVAIEPGIPCKLCHLCRSGKYNLCEEVRFCATPPVDGTLARYYAHPADFCFKLPQSMSYEYGALIEPLSVAVYSAERAEVGLGSKVLVLGAGPVGLLCLLVAKAAGAASIGITDILQSRLDFAEELGADYTLLANGHGSATAADLIKANIGEVNAAFECSGATSSLQLGIKCLKRRGILVTVGRGTPEVSLNVSQILQKELEIRGIFRYANCYQKALDLVSSGKVDLSRFVTHRFALEESEQALEAAHGGKGVKIMINSF
ncbi:sorbitol dehydrogenase-like isoform X2 [Artemia franciscana]|uniref:sorbitol dehydrogenase-like isoform X2 n=1 Tax=Artemia franciscana TaxID=6661 RepID=UPI0032DB51E0